jgi:isopentenyl diphosphate isomerase/L-lactate dehydrogenase-like FMN-dependent dehydrogenase
MSIPINLHEYEALAQERSPQMVFNYYAGGANDEITVAENRRAWGRVRLRPRVLVNVSRIDISTTVLGQPLTMPVLTAPCGFNALAHPEGECAVARATAATGIIQVVSTAATKGFEEIAGASHGQRWFQLYCYRDRAVTRTLVQAAEAAGYSAVCLTVDVPVLGRREPPESATAEAGYRQALALAETLGMRPLVAHCHLSLGTLYAKIGRSEQAHPQLSATIALYRTLEMTFWLPQAEAALAQVEGS